MVHLRHRETLRARIVSGRDGWDGIDRPDSVGQRFGSILVTTHEVGWFEVDRGDAPGGRLEIGSRTGRGTQRVFKTSAGRARAGRLGAVRRAGSLGPPGKPGTRLGVPGIAGRPARLRSGIPGMHPDVLTFTIPA